MTVTTVTQEHLTTTTMTAGVRRVWEGRRGLTTTTTTTTDGLETATKTTARRQTATTTTASLDQSPQAHLQPAHCYRARRLPFQQATRTELLSQGSVCGLQATCFFRFLVGAWTGVAMRHLSNWGREGTRVPFSLWFSHELLSPCVWPYRNLP